METVEIIEKSLGENLVVKANSMIEARYSLSLSAQRVFATAISTIDSRQKIEAEQYVEISQQAIKDLFGEVTSNTYYTLKQGLDDLIKGSVTIMAGEEKGTVTNWIQSYRFDNRTQSLEVLFTREVIPYISQLNSNFTKYKLKNLVKLTSVYAVRLFEYCCMWLGQERYLNEFSLKDFREMLGVPKGKYQQFGQLKDRVIATAVDQINIYTDFTLEVAFRKAGRSFSHIQLRLNIKEKPESIKQRKFENKIAKTRRLQAELQQAQKELTDKAMSALESLPRGTQFLDDKDIIYTIDTQDPISIYRTDEDGHRFYVSNIAKFAREWYLDGKLQLHFTD